MRLLQKTLIHTINGPGKAPCGARQSSDVLTIGNGNLHRFCIASHLLITVMRTQGTSALPNSKETPNSPLPSIFLFLETLPVKSARLHCFTGTLPSE